MKRWISHFFIFTLLLTLTACTNNQILEHAPDKKEDLVIHDTHSNDGRQVVGISMPSQTLERWKRDGNFLKQQFESEGCEVLVSFGNDLIDEQIDGIEDMIEQRVDLLIIAPINASSLENVLKKAAEASIPVISYDRLMLQSPYIDYYVSFDNYKVGTLQGEYIRDMLDLDHAGKKTYNIEFVSGDPADNNARYFYGGAHDVLSPYIESGVLSVPSGQTGYFQTSTSSWSTDLAKERFAGILTSYYVDGTKLSAVCCSNDSTALGVVQAITEDYMEDNDIIVTGQDGDEENIKNIIDGNQSMTVFKALSNESIVTLALGMAILNGETPGEDLIKNSSWDFPCVFDTTSYDNGEKVVPSYLLEPIVITKENMKEELVDTGYYIEDNQGYLHAAE